MSSFICSLKLLKWFLNNYRYGVLSSLIYALEKYEENIFIGKYLDIQIFFVLCSSWWGWLVAGSKYFIFLDLRQSFPNSSRLKLTFYHISRKPEQDFNYLTAINVIASRYLDLSISTVPTIDTTKQKVVTTLRWHECTFWTRRRQFRSTSTGKS